MPNGGWKSTRLKNSAPPPTSSQWTGKNSVDNPPTGVPQPFV
jgi:hypothetical protein